MKLNGRAIDQPCVKTVVLPRESGDLIFEFKAVLNFEDHDKLNPLPTPPMVLRPGGKQAPDLEDPEFQASVFMWSAQKYYWTFLQSISSTPGLVWDTVVMNDPKTWTNYRTELKVGFSEGEVSHLEKACLEVNGLNEEIMEQARQRFLATQQESKKT